MVELNKKRDVHEITGGDNTIKLGRIQKSRGTWAKRTGE